MPNIQDVAKKANVSVATVSRVLNNKDNVAEKSKKAVLNAIKELDYRPNLLARNLREQKSSYILVLVPSLSNDFYSKLIYGIQKVAETKRYHVMVCSINTNIHTERQYFNLLFNKLVDGIILTAPEVDKKEIEKLNKKYPIVQCSEYVEGADVSFVTVDNYNATKDAIEHLIQNGHKNIAFIGSAPTIVSAKERKRAYIDKLNENGIKINKKNMYEDSYSFKTGENGTYAIMNNKDRPTAIFCCSDSLAIGSVRAITKLNLKVGSDVCVMGFDGTNIAKYNTPSISTVEQPRVLMGETAMELLLKKIIDINYKNEKIVLPYKIIIRDSTNIKLGG